MAWIRLGLIMCSLLSPGCVSEQQQQRSHGGFKRLYVVQPGPGPGSGSAVLGAGVPVSPLTTHHGKARQPQSYNVEVSADLGAQVRTRVMRSQAGPAQQQLITLSGVNVCGGQCCHGWSKAQGSQRCTKPNCIPQCQNGGMCLRPQLCVCKPGSKGSACEHQTLPTQPFPAQPGNAPKNGHTAGNTRGYNLIPQWPIPQQQQPSGFMPSANNMAQMKLTVKPVRFMQPHYIQQHIQQQIRPVSAQSQHIIVKPKNLQTPTTQKQMKVHGHPERPIPLTVGQNTINVAGNHTGRIKVVFTPTICKVTCIGGRCQNNCELGNTTTIISENGHTTDTLTAPNFRVVVCHMPCMNGGKCSARDKCQCPSSFTGKFCQMPVQSTQQQPLVGYGATQVHSTHTLPLTYSNGQNPGYGPSIVNIHIQHPPEASVHVHQVSQLDNHQTNGHRLKGSQSGSSSSTSYSYHHTESSQKVHHHGYNLVYPSQHGYQVPQHLPVATKNTLGRCFQETAGSQCGKALPGLTKQEQCCGTIGTSWGFHKCQKCPKKPSLPLIDCPQGYRRINSSECQDLDECQLQGVCPNGNCINTLGSYRCICNPGYLPDSTYTTCTPNTAKPDVQDEKGACFRLVSSGRHCMYPVSTQLSKQLCCCSVGKAWGPRCDKCPLPGTAKFKDICPGGMGYTVLPNPPVSKTVTIHQEPTNLLPPRPLPTPERTVEAFSHPVEVMPEVIEITPPPAVVEILPSNAGQDIAPIQSTEVDECQINPYICGSGICYNTAESYSCHCDEGFILDDAQTTCIDVDECQDQKICIRGHCQNGEGSFICHCEPGFTVSTAGDQCDDVDECSEEPRPCKPVGECINTLGSYTCNCPRGYQQFNSSSCQDVDECLEESEVCPPHGKCSNTRGSYSCVCDSGFTAIVDPPSCEDIDECALNDTICGPHGFCENTLGSFQCLCDQGYKASQHNQSCMDVNECELLSSVCGEAQCVNVHGSFTCVCPSGQEYNVMVAKCEPVPTASLVERKECYYHLNDENLCESVLTSHVTLQECCCTLGAGWGDNCEVHPCPVNETDQFKQMCPSGRGYIPSRDSFYRVPISNSYINADECTLFGQEVCKGGFCLDTKGSYECYCKTGQDYDPVRLECRDINECLDELICAGGQCMNTEGSYMCFCTYPMMLDPSSNQCVFNPEVGEQHKEEQVDYQGICWQMVTKTMTCTQPLGPNRKTTYTECCCQYGEAWGMECALCPPRNTDDYASMCNLPLSSIRRPYGHDALVAVPAHKYEASQDYSPSPEEQPISPFYENEEHPYEAFEGLHAEECGILNGCENGRCVRVQEGYTCDCFDGYTLDLSRMACVDVNECSELETTQVPLCQNAKCVNVIGSYQCVCLPGFKASNKRNYCVQVETKLTSTQAH